MTDVTHILAALEAGDALAADQLLPLVYDELRRLAAEDNKGDASICLDVLLDRNG